MTLFGTTLDGVAIASLCGLLATLLLWIFALRGERHRIRWFRDWEAQRKARRDAEIAAEQADRPRTGPWG